MPGCEMKTRCLLRFSRRGRSLVPSGQDSRGLMRLAAIRKAAFAAVLFAALGLIAPVAQSQSENLTGIWEDDAGVQYQLRQTGDELYWYMAGGPRVINVFYGTIAGDIITGEWADLPGGRLDGSGQLSLQVEANHRLVKLASNPAYGASFWTRKSSAETSQASTARTTNQRTPLDPDWDLKVEFISPPGPLPVPQPPPSFGSSTSALSADSVATLGDQGLQRKPHLMITGIELEKMPTEEDCYWSNGNIVFTIQNTGDAAFGSYYLAGLEPFSIRAEATDLRWDDEQGKYVLDNTHIRFPARGHPKFRMVLLGMEPGETRTVTGTISWRTHIGDFFVRAELIANPGKSEEQAPGGPRVIQTAVKNFSRPGFNLSIPEGSAYFYFVKKPAEALLTVNVQNKGDRATPGPIYYTVRIPFKNKDPKLGSAAYYAEWKISFSPLGPGRVHSSDFVRARNFNPERGEPDFSDALFEAYVDCGKGKLKAFDWDQRDNYFFGRSRTITKTKGQEPE